MSERVDVFPEHRKYLTAIEEGACDAGIAASSIRTGEATHYASSAGHLGGQIVECAGGTQSTTCGARIVCPSGRASDTARPVEGGVAGRAVEAHRHSWWSKKKKTVREVVSVSACFAL